MTPQRHSDVTDASPERGSPPHALIALSRHMSGSKRSGCPLSELVEGAVSATPCASSITSPQARSTSVTIPSGEVKLNRGFTLAADAATTILLDFDGDRSIQEAGNGRFTMSPVIGIVSVQ